MTVRTFYPRTAPFMAGPVIPSPAAGTERRSTHARTFAELAWTVFRGLVMFVPILVVLIFVLIGIVLDDTLPGKEDTP